MRKIAILKECSPQEQAFLAAAAPDDQLLYFSNKQSLLSSPDLEGIQIVLGEPGISTIQKLKNLRWIQMTWAGANKYTSAPDFPRHITLTNASGAFGGIISEHIIAGVLALYKNLRSYRAQLQRGLWQQLPGDDSLAGKRALILGTGNIGTETAKKLKAFDAHTVGIRRSQSQASACFDECYPLQQLDEQLVLADLVIVALPGTPETAHLFDAQRFSKMKPGAVFVNVGRGFIVCTEALTAALKDGTLRGAVLDVTDPEPLPADHPLRFLENVILTPHVSGISWGENLRTREKILEIFRDNLQRDSQNLPLKNVIDFTLGY